VSNRHYELRSYLWKGEPFVAVYCGRARLGYLAASGEVAADMARRLGATLVELGEVRNVPTVTAVRVTDWSGRGDAP
jgi:hypothetical protein